MAKRDARDDQQTLWPNVWSGGQVYAFSGLDGPTQWQSAVGARLLPRHLGFAFDTDPLVQLIVRVISGEQVFDAVDANGDGPPARVAACRIDSAGVAVEVDLGKTFGVLRLAVQFVAQDLLRGLATYTHRGPGRAALLIELSSPALVRADEHGVATAEKGLAVCFQPAAVTRVVPQAEVLAAVRDLERFESAAHQLDQTRGAAAGLYRIPLEVASGHRTQVQFAVAFGPPATVKRPELLNGQELSGLVEPAPFVVPQAAAKLPPLRQRARAKAIAILRAHVFAPEGNLPHHWIVPQRFKHRNFNTFHAPFLALGALEFNPELAAAVLRCALAQQQATGNIPEQAWPVGQSVEIPPPLLCWGYWRVYRRTGDRTLLEDAVPRLKDYVKYPLAARMLERLGYARSRGAKFLSWGRGQGSNMDNSPRFDINESFAAVDLTSYAAHELALIARMIEEITPEHREAVHLGWMGEELCRETHEYFWDEEHSFFYDRYPDGDRVDVRTLAGLIPLYAGVATPEQAGLVVERHIRDANGFWTELPLASLARDDARFDQNMWRGGTWPGMNMLILDGLRRYGFNDLADELRERTVDGIAKWYGETGSLWEFYDSTGQRSPDQLPRGRRRGAMPDYCWTAAAYLALLHEAADA